MSKVSQRDVTVAALRQRAEEIESGTQPASRTGRTSSSVSVAIDINQEIARERKLRNDNVEQDISLKRSTLSRLFIFLTAETVVIFMFALFQAVHWPAHFALDKWSFDLLITATIAQITGMLFVAVRYLFPPAPKYRSGR